MEMNIMESKLDSLVEVVTITKVNEFSVDYDSKYYDGCSLSTFPRVPKVGEQWRITSSWGEITSVEPLTNL
jgi:hypothetical protein